MPLKQKIEQDLLDFMRSKNEIGRNTLRMVIASIKMFEIEKSSSIDDSSIMAIIQKEIKTRRDSITDFAKGNRQDLIETALSEISILESYLPKQLSDSEVEQEVKGIINEIGASSPADIGKVMKVVIPKLAGKTSSDKISQAVRKLLSNG
jgi:uncharacterized protein YqeY